MVSAFNLEDDDGGSHLLAKLNAILSEDDAGQLQELCTPLATKRKILNYEVLPGKRLVHCCIEKSAPSCLDFLLSQDELNLNLVNPLTQLCLLEELAMVRGPANQLECIEMVIRSWRLDASTVYPGSKTLPIILAAREAEPRVFGLMLRHLDVDLFAFHDETNAINEILQAGNPRKLAAAMIWCEQKCQQEDPERYPKMLWNWAYSLILYVPSYAEGAGHHQCLAALLAIITTRSQLINKKVDTLETLLQLAYRLGKVEHFRLLLCFHADPLAPNLERSPLFALLHSQPLKGNRMEMLTAVALYSVVGLEEIEKAVLKRKEHIPPNNWITFRLMFNSIKRLEIKESPLRKHLSKLLMDEAAQGIQAALSLLLDAW